MDFGIMINQLEEYVRNVLINKGNSCKGFNSTSNLSDFGFDSLDTVSLILYLDKNLEEDISSLDLNMEDFISIEKIVNFLKTIA